MLVPARCRGAELAVAIFELGRPIATQNRLEARPDGPAVHRLVVGEGGRLTARRREAVAMEILPGVAAHEIEQRRGTHQHTGARQHRPAQPGVRVDVGISAGRLRRRETLEARVGELGQETEHAALGDPIVEAAVDRAQHTAAARSVKGGADASRRRRDRIDRAAPAERRAEIEAGPDRSVVRSRDRHRSLRRCRRRHHEQARDQPPPPARLRPVHIGNIPCSSAGCRG
jgi:hypothetical protein